MLLQSPHGVLLFGQLLLGHLEEGLELGGRLAQVLGQLLLLLQTLLHPTRINSVGLKREETQPRQDYPQGSRQPMAESGAAVSKLVINS